MAVGGDLAAAVQRRLDVLDVLKLGRAGRSASCDRRAELGVVEREFGLCTKTASLVGRNPARSSACSARWDSPENPSTSEILFWLTVIPTTTATTKPNQPKIAALRCVALQRPIRAARLVG